MILKLLKKIFQRAVNVYRVALLKLKFRGSIRGRGISIDRGVRFERSGNGIIVLNGPTWFQQYISLQAYGGQIKIGEKTSIGSFTIIAAMMKISIGSSCMIAESVSIRDHDHVFDNSDIPFRDQGWSCKPIEIGNNVWLGAKVTVLKGCKIGDNVIIGANSVVTRDIPSNSVAVGCPARVIRNLH